MTMTISSTGCLPLNEATNCFIDIIPILDHSSGRE